MRSFLATFVFVAASTCVLGFRYAALVAHSGEHCEDDRGCKAPLRCGVMNCYVPDHAHVRGSVPNCCYDPTGSLLKRDPTHFESLQPRDVQGMFEQWNMDEIRQYEAAHQPAKPHAYGQTGGIMSPAFGPRGVGMSPALRRGGIGMARYGAGLPLTAAYGQAQGGMANAYGQPLGGMTRAYGRAPGVTRGYRMGATTGMNGMGATGMSGMGAYGAGIGMGGIGGLDGMYKRSEHDASDDGIVNARESVFKRKRENRYNDDNGNQVSEYHVKHADVPAKRQAERSAQEDTAEEAHENQARFEYKRSEHDGNDDGTVNTQESAFKRENRDNNGNQVSEFSVKHAAAPAKRDAASHEKAADNQAASVGDDDLALVDWLDGNNE